MAGDLCVTGSVFLTATCPVMGNLRVGDSVGMDSAPRIGGAIPLGVDGDATIIANGFGSIDGLAIKAWDANPHTASLVTAGTRTCGTAGGVDLSVGTSEDTNTPLNVDSAGKPAVNATSSISGRVTAPCLKASGAVTVGR